MNSNILLGISIILAVFSLFFYLVYAYEKKRSKLMHATANKLGLQFDAKPDDKESNKYLSTYLFSIGQNEGIINRIWGKENTDNIAIFEHKYNIPSGEGSSSTKHTVVALEKNDNVLPSFLLRPCETRTSSTTNQLLGKIGGMLEDAVTRAPQKNTNFKEIKLSTTDSFSEKYYLSGEKEAEVKNLFNSEVLDFLEKEADFHIENQGDIFLCYYKSTRFSAKEIPAFIETAKTLHKLLLSTANVTLSL